MRKRICLVFLLPTLLTAGSGTAGADPVTWPVDLPDRHLTSNFMEYRSGRFHAGLDFKTQSRMGFPVRAVEDGWIRRVRSSPGAYGRAVYLQGVSGRTYVYAHLMRFNDDLRRRVRARQAEEGTYRVQLSWGQGSLPVKAGRVLGLSGQSGTTGPHLHFEVRDNQQRPLNPQDHGFAPADTFAPVIHTVRAWPASAAARIQGRPVEHVVNVDGAGDLPPLHVTGPVAFSARIVDRSDVMGHRLEPWRITVQVDAETVYECRNERFSFSENSLQRLEWATGAAPSEAAGIREHWLHRRPGTDLYGRAGGLWFNDLPDGTHRVRILAEDRAGGRTEAAFDLVVGSAETSEAWAAEPRGLRDLPTAGLVVTPFFTTGQAGSDLSLRRLSAEAGDPVLADTWLVTWPVHGGAELEVAGAQSLSPAGPAAVFAAADWPVDGPVPVVWPASDRALSDGPGVGVYRFDSTDGWEYVGPADQSSPLAGFLLETPGLHAVLKDPTPPMFQAAAAPIVVDPDPVGSVGGVTLPRWTVFPVTVRDAGSGVAAETIRASLNGGRLIVEPDLIRDRVLVELPDSLAPGRHELILEAADEAGNVSTATYRLFCTEETP